MMSPAEATSARDASSASQIWAAWPGSQRAASPRNTASCGARITSTTAAVDAPTTLRSAAPSPADSSSTAVNQTRSREAVLTARQWSDVSRLAAQGASNEALLAGLDGTEVRLVVDDSTALDAHVEVIAAGVLDRRARTLGRGRR